MTLQTGQCIGGLLSATQPQGEERWHGQQTPQ
jgi:hypothetical protein